MDDKLLVFDKDKNLKFVFKGYKIGSIMQADKFYLYGLNEGEYEHSVKDKKTGVVVSDQNFRSPGLYIYDLEQIL